MSTPAMDANSFLMAGGAKSARFEQPGAFVTGRISEQPVVQQQKDFSTGEPLFWNDGQPRMQLSVTLATDQRDPADADDDGSRRIYVKGQMKQAIQQAVRASGARGLEVGGVLKVTYVRNGTASNPRFNPPKEYAAEYTPAAQAELNTPEPAAPAGVNTTTGEITTPAAPAAPGQPDLNDPAVQALLAQLQGRQQQAAPAANGGSTEPPPF